MGVSDSRLSVELKLADDLADLYAKPFEFVMYAFAWGEGELEGETGPDAWQEGVLRSLGDRVMTLEQALVSAQEHDAIRDATASGHGIGKSALVAWIILWQMSTRTHLNGVVTANTSKQLEQKTWRELAVWHKRAINVHWFEWTATKFYKVSDPETWFVAAVPWTLENTEAFAGTHAKHVLLIFDEGSGIPDAIWEVAEGAQTSGSVLWCVFGNPTRPSGRFRECFSNGRFAHRWTNRQIDSRTCKKANKRQAEQWITDYGDDSDFVRVRVKGQFPRAGATQLISTEVVEFARKREVMVDFEAPLVLGVDIARFGDDQTVLRYRRGRDARSIAAVKYRGIDTMQCANFIVQSINTEEPDVICIDGNGVGGGVVDRVRQLLGETMSKRVFEVQNGSKATNERDYFNKRAECWGLMRDMLEESLAIDDDALLLADLCGPEYGYDLHNRLQLERKEDMKKRGIHSPDDGDALALTFAVAVGRRPQKDKPKPRVLVARAATMTGSTAWQN